MLETEPALTHMAMSPINAKQAAGSFSVGDVGGSLSTFINLIQFNQQSDMCNSDSAIKVRKTEHDYV